MPRKGRPKELNVFVSVFHADALERPVDADDDADLEFIGEPVKWGVHSGNRSPHLVTAEIKHGVSRQTAAKLLRQIADAIQKAPQGILATPCWEGGHYDVEQQTFVNEWPGLGDLDTKNPEIV